MKRRSLIHIQPGTTPLLLLAVSASVSTVARGEEASVPQSEAGGSSLAHSDQSTRSLINEGLASGVWIMPVDGDKQSNSRFLQKLLLSHGVQIDLDKSEFLDTAQFAESLRQAPSTAVTIDEFDLTVLVEMDALLNMPKPVQTSRLEVSDQWEVLWLDLSADGDFDEEQARLQVKQSLEKKLSSPNSQWQLDVLISRPATVAELAALKQQGKYPLPLKSDAALQSGLVGRQQSKTPIKKNKPRKGVLKRWLSTLPLDVDLDDDCSVQNAISEYLKNPESVTPPKISESGQSANVMNNGVSSEWEVRWLDCEIDLGKPAMAITDDSSLNKMPDINLGTSSTGVAKQTPPVSLSLDELPADRSSSPAPATAEEATGMFGFDDDVPPGFENLAGPQTQYVDVYFNERKVGSTSITATAEVFTFDEPIEVAGMLQGIKDSASLHSLLAVSLDTNGHLICYTAGDPPGCGIVDADPVAAIFNDAELRVDLFIAPELQSVQALERLRYLPVPGSKNTSILSLYAVSSKLEDEDAALDVSARALLGYGRGNFSLEADYNSRTERQRLREIKLTHYFNDYELGLGTYSHSPGGGLADIDLLGGSFSTSYKSRIDLERAFSSDLIVYLPRRSVVQVAVDDRIYSGDSYDAGNQAIDTTALPDGSYEVEIRIIDPLSGSRTETRVFTKSTQIPPKGESVISVTAGNVIEFGDDDVLPEINNVSVAGFTLGNRLTDQSAFKLGLLQFGTQSFIQSEFLYLGERISLQLAASAGEDSTLASAFRVAYARSGVSLNITGNYFGSEFEPGPDPSEQAAYQRMFPNDYQQVSASIGKAFKRFSLGARTSYRKEDTDVGINTSKQYSVYYRQPVFRQRNLRGFVDANLQQDDFDRRLKLQFNVYFGRGQWNGGIQTAARRTESEDWEHQWGADVGWHSASNRTLQWQTGTYLRSEQSFRSAGAHLDVEHPWFTAGIASDWNEASTGGTVQNSIASLSAHIGLDKKGGAIGGSDFAQAGVIIAVDGEPAGAKFDVFVNNIKIAAGQIGASQFIGLQPFERYSVKLVPQTTLSNGLGEDIHEFTLYPGTVERISITAQQEIMLVGTLIDESGEIIANALMQTEPNPLIVDASGYVQAELQPGKVVTVKLSDGSYCEFTVPSSAEEDIVVMAEPIECRAIEKSEPKPE